MPTLARKSRVTARTARAASTARLEARIPFDLKELIETAAPLAGHTSVTDYLVQTLRKNASQTVEEARRIRLEAEESVAFVQSLLAPSEPNQTLKAAFTLHRKQVR